MQLFEDIFQKLRQPETELPPPCLSVRGLLKNDRSNNLDTEVGVLMAITATFDPLLKEVRIVVVQAVSGVPVASMKKYAFSFHTILRDRLLSSSYLMRKEFAQETHSSLFSGCNIWPSWNSYVWKHADYRMLKLQTMSSIHPKCEQLLLEFACVIALWNSAKTSTGENDRANRNLLHEQPVSFIKSRRVCKED
ncbi:hypothetical protein AVEN_256956-1 [Araneus ventricosus]|uniref:Uncharacterized protein n=1 Tax=Araneus ventricosus TaxID=182803 RepID=A0A4Y2ED51_ARAVE|nr:hypothetical protein AVEN_256956-1 [Araneus ventricosus]